jgi:hypothetical protein
MSVPPIAKATLQATVINAGANVLAQAIKAYRNDVSIFLDSLLVISLSVKELGGQIC